MSERRSESRKLEIDLKPLNDLAKLIEKSFNEAVKPTPPKLASPPTTPSPSTTTRRPTS